MATRPAIIVVSSHVARGTVGARAASFALERLGFPVWVVPSVVLPFHPGHGPGERIVPPGDAFARLVDDLIGRSTLEDVGAVLTGYLGAADQVAAVARLVGAVKAARPDALYCCDPVLGDAGRLYVSAAQAEGMRDVLLPLADLATPNRFELEWLSGREAGDLGATEAIASALGPKRVVVTSAGAMRRGNTGALLVGEGPPVLAEHRHIEGAPKGTGDLFAALLLARLLEGRKGEMALRLAASGTLGAIAASLERGEDELALEAEQDAFVAPRAPVATSRLETAQERAKGARLVPRPLL